MVIIRTPEPPDGHRDGETYNPEFDYDRLNKQMKTIWRVVNDGKWHTLPEVEERTGVTSASAGARIRDLRKARFGRHDVQRKYLGDGLYAYRVAGRRK